MGIFDFFKKKTKFEKSTTDNDVLGPTYLENVTVHISNPKNLISNEWRRQLKTKAGETKFRIKYYGQLHKIYKSLIVDTEFSKPLIYALDITNNQEILLWDGCKYGYNPIFCDEFTEEQIVNRKAENIYKDKYEKNIFEIVIMTYTQYNFEDEIGDLVNDNGMIELHTGNKITLEEAKHNAFDFLGIFVTNDIGKTTEIVSEELA